MGHLTEAFIGLGTGKLRIAVAVAESGINGQVYFYGEIVNTEAALRKLISSGPWHKVGVTTG